MNQAKQQSGGIGFCSVLFFIFLPLKLCGVIDWSWWLVTAPLWLPFAVLLAFAGLFLTIAGVVAFLDQLQKK